MKNTYIRPHRALVRCLLAVLVIGSMRHAESQTPPCLPLSVSVSSTGTLGNTLWGYVVSDSSSLSTNTQTSQIISTLTGPAQLSSANSNTITFTTDSSSSTYYIYRMIVGPGGSPSTVGYLGTCPGSSCSGSCTSGGHICMFTDNGSITGNGAQPPYNPPLNGPGIAGTFSTAAYPSYETRLQGLMSTMLAQIAPVPQPAPLLSGQQEIAVNEVITSGFPACVPNYCLLPLAPCGTCYIADINLQNAYTDALVRAGVQAIDINMDITPLRSSYEYNTLVPTCSPGTNCLPNDCDTITNPGGLQFGNQAGVNDGPWCKMLYLYDQMLTHAQSKGLKIRLAPAYSAYTNANLPDGCGLLGANLEATVQSCYQPFYTALATRWQSLLESVTVIHEPDGAWNPITNWTASSVWTPAEVITWITGMRCAVKGLTGCPGGCSNCLVGAAVESSTSAGSNTMTNAHENVHWQWWMTSPNTGLFDFAAIDVYPNSWDPSQQMVPVSFTGTCSGVGGSFNNCAMTGGGAYPLVQSWVSTANTAAPGLPLRVNESNRPVWVPAVAETSSTGCFPSGANGILDNAASEWLNDGLDVAWQSTFVPWAAAQVFGSVSQYATRPWVSYNPQNYNTDLSYIENILAVTGGSSYVPLNIGNTTLSGNSWATSSERLVSLQSAATTSGNVNLSH